MNNGYPRAIIYCKECDLLFTRDYKRSESFRQFCSMLGSKPNRDPSYYTSSEMKIKEILDELNIQYEHNKKFNRINHNGRKIYYWVDFYLPEYNVILECNPKIWQHMWGRWRSALVKKDHFKLLGIEVLEIEDKYLYNKESLKNLIINYLNTSRE